MSNDHGDQSPDLVLIFDSEFPRLVAYGMSIGLRRHAAEDIAQEAFVQAHQRWDQIDYPGAYLRQIVYHLAIRPSRETACADPGGGLPSTLPGTADLEERSVALQALEQLPSQQRAVFALTLDGYTSSEIARILAMNKDTVRSHLRHARKTLAPWWDTLRREEPR